MARTPEPGDPHRDHAAITRSRDWAALLLARACPDPDDPASWPAWRTLHLHISALAGRARPDTDTQVTAILLNEAGVFADSQGQATQAIGYMQVVLAAIDPSVAQSDSLWPTSTTLASAIQAVSDSVVRAGL